MTDQIRASRTVDLMLSVIAFILAGANLNKNNEAAFAWFLLGFNTIAGIK